MTIQQSNHYRADVENLVRLGTDYKYTVGREKIAADALARLARFRGAEYTRLAAAKANQRLKNKFFDPALVKEA